MPNVASERVEELIKQLKKVENGKDNHTYEVDDAISPLPCRVKDTHFPRQFKMPSLNTFSRSHSPLIKTLVSSFG